ncbi:hypothetical protein [Crocosphaera chwakensis]|uniref:Uncharacterized protein n=1 Tax=Crocosphaera chwakensis CCY0110 TaxID=391612 RepID=A3IZR4_9CHRO|nr:hypothetical protein [Crocosphaera chwakensis]EAZ88032.1 hypothetical protein CY0110_30955 [Crocosphaera chwakensis CCY0110]
MASIILSFVGSQDPYSEKNHEEGSLVTLVRHLVKQSQEIRKIGLLYTVDTQPQAELTKDWLCSEVKISSDLIELHQVSVKLSEDPINVESALKEAHTFCSKIIESKQNNDIIEFNSSSGTPAMKTAWGILQASGSWGKSNLWQVRNPFQMKPHQSRVFVNNVNVVKNQSDLKVIKKQLKNYNYYGTLETLKNSGFSQELIQELIEAGAFRLAFNFDQAFSSLKKIDNLALDSWEKDIIKLRQRNSSALLKEVYYKAEINLRNQKYADFLILVFCFQENLLRYLVKKMILPPHQVDKNWNKLEKDKTISKTIQKFDEGKLKNHLENYRLVNGEKIKLDFERFLNRIVLKAILDYQQEKHKFLLPLIESLEKYCQTRNDYIHNLEGVPKLSPSESEPIMNNIKDILQEITTISPTNPFDILNDQILKNITPITQG